MDILKYEKHFESKGYKSIVGIDEAGRGPLAGPVVAVALNWGKSEILEGVKDSKKISKKKRLDLFNQISQKALDIGIGIVYEDKIDEINILQSTYLAMRMAIGKLKIKPDILLIDGHKADINHFEQKNIIKGDSLSYSIACASIIAKVTRDLMMIEYGKIFPEYGFEKHKGYGTKFHIEMIKECFSCPIHRKTFKPINKYLPTFKNYKSDERIKLLGYQIVASEMIKKQYSIVLFNDTYDLLITDKNKLILLSIDVSVDNKTINSISPVNGVNFDNKIKEFLVKFDLNNINCFRIDFVTIRFLKSGPKIDIKKGELYEY